MLDFLCIGVAQTHVGITNQRIESPLCVYVSITGRLMTGVELLADAERSIEEEMYFIPAFV